MAFTISMAVRRFFRMTTVSVSAWSSTIAPFSKPLSSITVLGMTSFFFVVPFTNFIEILLPFC